MQRWRVTVRSADTVYILSASGMSAQAPPGATALPRSCQLSVFTASDCDAAWVSCDLHVLCSRPVLQFPSKLGLLVQICQGFPASFRHCSCYSKMPQRLRRVRALWQCDGQSMAKGGQHSALLL